MVYIILPGSIKKKRKKS